MEENASTVIRSCPESERAGRLGRRDLEIVIAVSTLFRSLSTLHTIYLDHDRRSDQRTDSPEERSVIATPLALAVSNGRRPDGCDEHTPRRTSRSTSLPTAALRGSAGMQGQQWEVQGEARAISEHSQSERLRDRPEQSPRGQSSLRAATATAAHKGTTVESESLARTRGRRRASRVRSSAGTK